MDTLSGERTQTAARPRQGWLRILIYGDPSAPDTRLAVRPGDYLDGAQRDDADPTRVSLKEAEKLFDDYFTALEHTDPPTEGAAQPRHEDLGD